MGMFTTREPRKFNRVSIYTDERRDKLKKLVEQVRHESEDHPTSPLTEKDIVSHNRFKGKFSEYTPRTQRYSQNGRSKLTWPIALIAIIILIMVWHYLQTGNVHL